METGILPHLFVRKSSKITKKQLQQYFEEKKKPFIEIEKFARLFFFSSSKKMKWVNLRYEILKLKNTPCQKWSLFIYNVTH